MNDPRAVAKRQAGFAPSAFWPLACAVLALASLSGPAPFTWPAVRALLFVFLGLAASTRLPSPAALPWLAAAFASLAALGWSGLDYTLALLAAGHLRLKRDHLTGLVFVVALSALLALFFRRDLGPLPFPNRNHFAVFTELTLPFLVWRIKREDSRWAMIAASLSLAVSFAAGSRAGALLLGVEMLCLAWLWGRTPKLVAVSAALVCLASLFLLLHGGNRVQDPWAGDHRREIWTSALTMVQAKPFQGWGAGAFPAHYPAFALFDNGQFVNAAHSDWLEWAVEFGILPPALLLAGLFAYLARFRYSMPVWGILFGAVHAAVDYPGHQPGFLIFIALLAASFAHYAQTSNQHSHSHPLPTQSANAAR